MNGAIYSWNHIHVGIRLCSATCDWNRIPCACVSSDKQYLVNDNSVTKKWSSKFKYEAREMIRLSSHADYDMVSVYMMVSIHERRSQLQQQQLLLHSLHHEHHSLCLSLVAYLILSCNHVTLLVVANNGVVIFCHCLIVLV